MKKFWIWSLSIAGFFGVLTILCFTLFSLNSVRVEFHNATITYSTEEAKTEIIETANFSKTSVFLLDKQGYESILERSFPSLEIINIETVFPNNLVIHCNEREPVFAVKFINGYYICDTDFKVLEVLEQETYASTQSNYILLETYSSISTALTAGEFINIAETDVLKNISPSFELTNRNICVQMALIKEIKIINTVDVFNPLSQINYGLELTDFNGLKTIITVAKNKLAEKINLFCALQSTINPATHYLYIYENSNGKVESAGKLLD